MESGSNLSRNTTTQQKRDFAGQTSDALDGNANHLVFSAALQEQIPAGIQASLGTGRGEYDARRLRSQREIIRDVMLAAADCGTWLTLGELRALTRYGEASISAQLRHLRKQENGGYEVGKRHREDAGPYRAGVDGRGECVWEYRIARDGMKQTARPVEGQKVLSEL